MLMRFLKRNSKEFFTKSTPFTNEEMLTKINKKYHDFRFLSEQFSKAALISKGIEVQIPDRCRSLIRIVNRHTKREIFLQWSIT